MNRFKYPLMIIEGLPISDLSAAPVVAAVVDSFRNKAAVEANSSVNLSDSEKNFNERIVLSFEVTSFTYLTALPV